MELSLSPGVILIFRFNQAPSDSLIFHSSACTLLCFLLALWSSHSHFLLHMPPFPRISRFCGFKLTLVASLSYFATCCIGMVTLRHRFCNSLTGFVGATSESDLGSFSALWFYCCWMKRAVCFYSPVLFVEHRVFELYSHGALGQCFVSDTSQFPSCNCISQPWPETWVIFASSIVCFSQDCRILCNQGNSHATLLADMSTPFCLGPSRCFLPAFSPGKCSGSWLSCQTSPWWAVLLGKSDLPKNWSSSELCSGMALSALLTFFKVK